MPIIMDYAYHYVLCLSLWVMHIIMNYGYSYGLCISFSFHSAAMVKHLDQKQPRERRNLSGLYFHVSGRCGKKLGQELKQERKHKPQRNTAYGFIWAYI